MNNSSPGIYNGTIKTVQLSSGSETNVGSTSLDSSVVGSSSGYANSVYGTFYPSYQPYPYPTGYTCPSCGVYVYYGNYHSCVPKVISYPVYIYPQSTPVDLTPLLEKLDELTEEIKKLRKQN
jgi:hypothetical protein